jgi:hypothetical protein
VGLEYGGKGFEGWERKEGIGLGDGKEKGGKGKGRMRRVGGCVWVLRGKTPLLELDPSQQNSNRSVYQVFRDF